MAGGEGLLDRGEEAGGQLDLDLGLASEGEGDLVDGDGQHPAPGGGRVGQRCPDPARARYLPLGLVDGAGVLTVF